MANELQDLPEASKLMGSFQKAPKGYIGPKEIAPALQEIDVKAAEAQKQLGESDVRIEKAKREEAAATGELKKAFYEKEKAAELAMPERAAAKAAREDLAAAKFEPTKDTVQDIAGLFSLMGVVGMVIGKKNALQGMYAMNGMMEGHIKGRKDLFTREAAEFDKQFKILQAKVESTVKELEDARKLRIYDQKAGEEAIAIAVARSESPLIKEMTARLGIEKTINVLNQTKETVSKMAGLQNDLQKAADDRALRKSMLDVQRQKIASNYAVTGNPETMEEYINGIANYSLAPPGIRDKNRVAIMSSVLKKNPQYDENEYRSIGAAEKNWTSGYGSKQVQTFNTVATHLRDLENYAKGLNNKDTRLENAGLNALKSAFGAQNVTDFNTARQIVAGEVVRAITNTGGGVTDRQQAENNFSSSNSPQQLLGSIDVAKGLIRARMEAAEFNYRASTNKEDFNKFLTPETQRIFGISNVLAPAVSPAPQQKVMPSGEKLKSYAKEHFEGNEKAAKDYLSTQGYK
jgi:hypothetical protein